MKSKVMFTSSISVSVDARGDAWNEFGSHFQASTLMSPYLNVAIEHLLYPFSTSTVTLTLTLGMNGPLTFNPTLCQRFQCDSRLHLTDPRFTGGKWNLISVGIGSGVSQFNFVSLGVVQIAIDGVRLISGSCNQGATGQISLLLSLHLFLSF